jgi:hypothetical protein
LRRPAVGQALGATAALAAALAAAGCTSAPAGTASRGATGRPAITAAQARQVWNHYVAASGAQIIMTGNPAPAFYLPEQSGYPRFFVVAVTQKLTSGYPSAAAAPLAVDGAEVHPFGPRLMLFEQASADAPWLLGSTSNLAVGEPLPKLATDSAGYIPVVTPSAATLLAQPGEVGALQAAVVDDGPASTATRTVADGQLTTGLYRGALSHADGVTVPHGDVYQWELEGTSYPEYALRTAAGGALVFYSMALDTTVAVPGYINKADPVRSGPPIQMPSDIQRLLPAGQPAPLIALQAEQLLSFAAIDPPSTGGKIRVIAMGGGLTTATAS